MRSSQWPLKYTLGVDGVKRPRSCCLIDWKYHCKVSLASHRQLKAHSNKIPAKESFKKDSIIWYIDVCFYLSTYPSSIHLFAYLFSLFIQDSLSKPRPLNTHCSPWHGQSCRCSTPALVASAFLSPSLLKLLLLLVYCHWFQLRLQLYLCVMISERSSDLGLSGGKR